MTMSRAVTVLFCVMGLWGCKGSEAAPMVLGSPHVLDGDRDDADPAVVNVRTSVGSCTGTLIAPRYVLTARHCVREGGRVSVSWRSRAGDGPRTDARIHLPPESNGLADDIAVLELAEPSSVTPIAPNLDGRAIDRLSEIRVVGYGLTGTNRSDSGIRRSGTARAVVSRSFVESVRGTGGTCYGDSGGPALAMIDGRERVVGVTSHGTRTRCEDGHTRFVRTDVHRAFLAQFVSPTPVQPPPTRPTNPVNPPPPDDNTIAAGDGVSVVRSADGTIRITTKNGTVVVGSNGSSTSTSASSRSWDGCGCEAGEASTPRRRSARRVH
jgi:secreted trypsin-like serine protease